MKVKDTLLEIQEQNEELKARNEFLERCVEALKLNLSAVTLERNKLVDKVHFLDQKCNAYHKEVLEITHMGMWDFADKYCSDSQVEADARLFAKELLHSRVTGEYKNNELAARIAEEEFINQGEAHYERTWNINCGDDF